jgi:D-alanine--poly(phosphoribitol) ligase subunit 1
MFQKIILDQFISAVEKFGSDNAFCINEKFYTYSEFAQTVSKIRKALIKFRSQSANIGLIANDDIETYASIFALWMEGLAYVPVHPHQPVERSTEIISQANIDLIINSGDKEMFSNLKTIKTKGLKFEGLSLVPKQTDDEANAYILFTSGSTGKPKGVPITRKNLSSFIQSFLSDEFEIDSTDRCLQCFDLTFDVSVQSFLVPLIKGACTYTIPHDQIKYSYVYGLLEDHKLTFSVMAPSMLRYLRPYFDELNVPSMKYCILTAEASPVDLVEEWSHCIPNAEIFDFYGPTEATIYCTYYKFKKDATNKHMNGMLSIGKPMKGLTAIILDENGNQVGLDQKGQLCISGNQLTPGYWNDPQKTAEAFFEREQGGSLSRFYKTGDSCYFDADGDILYAGRLDFQVKIQGYRIELGEIEYHARQYLKGQNAAAIPFENKSGNIEICMFVEGALTDTAALSVHLKTKLPYYMVPTRIQVNKNFPLNSNGKVDRNVLKSLIGK